MPIRSFNSLQADGSPLTLQGFLVSCFEGSARATDALTFQMLQLSLGPRIQFEIFKSHISYYSEVVISLCKSYESTFFLPL